MEKSHSSNPPKTLQELKRDIAKRQIIFPGTLERVAREVIDRPEAAAFETAAMIARRCNVSASTVQRLARHLGLRTFADLKAVLREYVRDSARRSSR
ncbi:MULTISPECIES: MurR/RpiR family transcriptional regulator [unclassified Sinorhizobium]|uniref:MurR/RpiR family transcriptional regulator n=1 Tax=unclassified Sinorhizobium TaxID=2613772 RepID=UPI0024C267D8|nr:MULTISPECIES: MurR/RpiR family transcriptional regulator [unclassified Sinorhizobium]MDK1377863.1 MurR/RpiR family transcriptional regulator [Sinorhizobium sp. 6-70]MDK1479862.1 MurR/RpiR family transcriptional regulator [Sinorhizobium sp. 6-117]